MKYTKTKSKNPLLQPHVEYFNSIQGDGISSKQFISLPEGKVGMFFMLGGHTNITSGQETVHNKTHRVCGLIQKPEFITVSKDIFTFAVVFKPGGLWHFLPDSPVDKVVKNALTLEAIYGKEIYRIVDVLFEAKSFEERVSILESFLLKQYKPTIPRIQYAVNLMSKLKGKLTVNDLGKQLNLSTRQLRNVFNDKIGLSPKQFLRLMRFNAILNTPLQPLENMAQFAAKIGCYDESHFIHEFKTFAGMTPKKYFGNGDFISDFSNYKRLMIE